MNQRQIDSTQAWVNILYGKNAIQFRLLKNGETFCFPKNQLEILTKTGPQSYSNENGQKFKTGAGSAVISVTKTETQALTGT